MLLTCVFRGPLRVCVGYLRTIRGDWNTASSEKVRAFVNQRKWNLIHVPCSALTIQYVTQLTVLAICY